MARQREPAGMKKPPLALGQRRLLPVRNHILRHVRSRLKITRIGRIVNPPVCGDGGAAGPKPRALVLFPWASLRCPPAVMFRRRSDETIFQSLRSRPEMITS